jgi:uncharacterized membrane protein (DUF2068 family)
MPTAESNPANPESAGAVDQSSALVGLRAVATFEAAKGLGALLLGILMLTLLHDDMENVAENLLFHLHISTHYRLSREFITAASHLTDSRIYVVAGGASAYSLVRFVEAWGLWHRRVWAEWFALLSGALYLPAEIFKLIEHPSWLVLGIFLVNIGIVAYMAYIRLKSSKDERNALRSK